MIHLKNVHLHKYKSIETPQSFDVESDVTTLVGKNEAGKTAVLEAIAKSNYFSNDPEFIFDATYDYPRKEKKQFDKDGSDVTVITCTYELSKELLSNIQAVVGKKAFTTNTITYSRSYRSNNGTFDKVKVNRGEFFKFWLKEHNITDKAFKEAISEVKSVADIEVVITDFKELSDEYTDELNDLKIIFSNKWNWDTPLSEYIARCYIKPRIPKFLYYDEYYQLPSEVDIQLLQSKDISENRLKTAKALFELADINVDDIKKDDEDYEIYKAELEATSNIITQTLFDYWKTNPNLRVQFDINKSVKRNGTANPEIKLTLKIRVWNNKYMMSLPLESRSKGFNWFFSFIVWFSKIQEDKDNDYILLLDEPGLNLHAKAQQDLLRYIDDLAKDYQVIYTTHSPFMISDDYGRVRTVLEAKDGTNISDSIDEKDPDTLFPLQASLGYDIAQNLFIAKKNLLVEGTSDLIILNTMSAILQEAEREGLADDITIVPVGGADKITTFISLLRGQKLSIGCLLDTFTDQKGKRRLDDLIRDKIIRQQNILFFDEFVSHSRKIADLEDMFEKEEYLNWFNEAFHEYDDISLTDLDSNEERIIHQINKFIGKPRFNHHRPANMMTRNISSVNDISDNTLDHFEAVFKIINKSL